VISEPRVKSLRVLVGPGNLQVEEDAHELGWDVDGLAHGLSRVGIKLRKVRTFPCDCEPCRRP